MPAKEALWAIVGGAEQRGRAFPTREVYFLQGEITGCIKIGVALDTRSRLPTLQSGSPDVLKVLSIIVCDRKGALEKELHQRFADHRLHGEWFRGAEELIRFALEHASPHEELLAHRRATREANVQPYRPKRHD